ncbi:hypothetical protein JIN77_01110 [Verrucomicrobiaceae bacterium R5-34]|nr:hypothetical protein [Verrucomicrobiaceae bacterium R5-34]
MAKMNDGNSPYEVSQSGMTPPPAPEAMAVNPTPVPKVFGIIHIVYACLGGIGALVAVGSVVMIKTLMAKVGGETEEVDVFLEAYQQMEVYTYIDAGLKLVLALLLLVAGIGLLKKRLWAQKLSVTWAVLRIVSAIVMTIVMMGPSREFQEKMGQVTENQPGAIDQSQLQGTMQGVSSVVGIIFLCIYPILTLVFLSRKSVKDVLR